MKKEKPNKTKEEKGITLIALIVMIAILVILSAVVIRGIAGNEGIVKTTADAAEDYNITAYKEQIEQEVRSAVIAKSAIGEEVTIEKIAEDLDNETLWVKKAEPNVDTSITNEDILITTVEGYVFQAYYNSIYGTVYVEYIGQDEKVKGAKGNFPNLKARFEKSLASILAETRVEGGKVEKLELIYRGEIVQEKEPEAGEMRLNVENLGTGWYKLRARTSEGKLRYAWVKATTVSEKLTPPIITLEPESPNGEANWYVTKPVKVNMVIDSVSATEIHYTITGAKIQEETVAEGKSTSFDIDTSGVMLITAWTEDGRGYQSEETQIEIKLDAVKPEITKAELIATKGTNGWIISNGEIKIEARDTAGILNGYEYEVTDVNGNIIKEKTHVLDINQAIKIEREGEYIVRIVAVDQAGNRSATRTIEIHKDTVQPTVGTPTVDNIVETSFRITVPAGDDTSKVGYYEYYIDGALKDKTNTGVCTITGLTPNQTYNAYVRVYDNAGLHTDTITVPVTTKGELLVPRIEISGTQNNGYYTGNVTVTITDTAGAGRTRATGIRYTTNGSNYQDVNGTSYTFTITQDGRYTINAYMKDSNGNTSGVSETKTPVRDTTPPTAPTISISGTGPTNNWYRSNITVTITPGTDSGSGVQKIRYAVTGANPVSERDGNGSGSTTITITADGTSNITAYTIDNAGHRSSTASREVKKDATPPSTAGITYQSKTANTITVSANGADALSGVANYTYQYKLNTASGYANATTITSTSYTYPSSIIQAGKTYNLRVIVIDNAGNQRESNVITVVTNTPPVFTQQGTGSVYDINNIRITATATDADGGNLTYTLHWGASTNYGNTETKTVAQGQQVTFEKTNLSNYTTYYFRIDVTDGTASVTGTAGSTRTDCLIKQCIVRTNERLGKDCDKCRGFHFVPVKSDCSGKLYGFSDPNARFAEAGFIPEGWPDKWSCQLMKEGVFCSKSLHSDFDKFFMSKYQCKQCYKYVYTPFGRRED